MQHFNFVFDLVMTGWPLAFAALFPAKPALQDQRLRGYRRRLGWLALATAGAWLLIVLVHLHVSQPYGLWALCFALWFIGAMPVLRIKRTDWHEPSVAASRKRQASLRSRVHVSPISRNAWLAAWTAWALLLVATIAQVDLSGDAVLSLFFGAMGAFWLGMGQYGTRWFLLEPEPLDTHGSSDLVAAYERLRRFKVYGWFGLACGSMLVFSAVSLMLALDAGVVPVVVAGAGGGSALGVLGGVFGTYASVLRGRINELRQRLDGGDAVDVPM